MAASNVGRAAGARSAGGARGLGVLHPAVVTLALLGALAGAIVAGVALGPVRIAPANSVGVILDLAGLPGGPAYAPVERRIIANLRLPRVLVAGLVGAGLAAVGATLQGLFRNPLADPGVTGVSAAGSFGAVLAIATGLQGRRPWSLPTLAFLFAAGAAFLVYALATSRGRVDLSDLLLAGIAIGALGAAGISATLTFTRDTERLREILFWLLGGFVNRGWGHVRLAAPPIALGLAAACCFRRDLNLLLAGEDEASSLGVAVPRLRVVLLVIASAVTAACVAVSGSIGFVGLVVPHAIRAFTGPDHRTLLPLSALAGAALLIATDTLARLILQPQELPVGVITAFLGAPFFLGLLVARRHRQVA